MTRTGIYRAEIELIDTPMKVDDTFAVVFFVTEYSEPSTWDYPGGSRFEVTGWRGEAWREIPSELEDYICEYYDTIVNFDQVEWD